MNREATKQAVVQSTQLWKQGGRDPKQKAPQAGCIGVTGQSREILKDAVLAQELGGFNSVEPQQNGIEQRQQHLADAVAVVALNESEVRGQRVLEADSCQEAVQDIDAP